MKKLLLLSFCVLISGQSFAQDPDLYRTWYLYEVQLTDLDDLYIVSEIDPPITPTLTITESLSFSGTMACNTFEGTYAYQNFELSETGLTRTSDDCENSTHAMFENNYYDFLHWYAFQINPDSNGLVLYCSTPLFGHAIFKDYPLSVDANSIVKFKMYPNPVSETLFISWENLQIENLSVYNLSGQTVLIENQKVEELNVSSLSAGLYFIEITSEAGKQMQKFVKH
ncbi:T9SS type A sorting domain-containing protein [Ulvibacter antarcticus]|uniref:Putative secreted protein (Por secretion system target) n=1 Tax=Ulvibacter antarcticus TaxID=442714 RepID=A0A3L9Z066_9FLAO|nr:T9SS type A sorting domain-containing protein [Ulvibacter antarcticus]RMA66233.1 putative secreted protein (Por secretion system target) [Ulvibacter antarcticus]